MIHQTTNDKSHMKILVLLHKKQKDLYREKVALSKDFLIYSGLEHHSYEPGRTRILSNFKLNRVKT